MTAPIDRRRALRLFAIGTAGASVAACGVAPAQAKSFRVSYTDAQWRQRLTSAEFYVLRQQGTERPYSSPLNKENRAGTFTCAGCGNALYSSKTKFDSGTGWPSFFREIEGHVGYKEDNTLFMTRTEEHCARCGGHLGHVFDDGPQPTGKRHCTNGVAMVFRPADGGDPIVG